MVWYSQDFLLFLLQKKKKSPALHSYLNFFLNAVQLNELSSYVFIDNNFSAYFSKFAEFGRGCLISSKKTHSASHL